MLQCIKFGVCKVKTLSRGSEWSVGVRHIGIALGVNSETLKGIVRNHLPQLIYHSFPEKNWYNGSKLFIIIPGVCPVILGSTHPKNWDVLDFLVKSQNHLQDQAWE